MGTYTAREVASLFGVTDQTILNWVKRGILPGTLVGLGRKTYRIPKVSVDALYAEHATKMSGVVMPSKAQN